MMLGDAGGPWWTMLVRLGAFVLLLSPTKAFGADCLSFWLGNFLLQLDVWVASSTAEH